MWQVYTVVGHVVMRHCLRQRDTALVYKHIYKGYATRVNKIFYHLNIVSTNYNLRLKMLNE